MRILVAGGGIGGLAAAIALAQRGFAVDVIEQQQEPREIGAGISFYANGTRLLTSLGVDPALRGALHPASGVRFMNGATAALIAVADFGDFHIKRSGAPSYELHRADLHAALLETAKSNDRVKLHLGHRVTGIAQDGARVSATTSRGAVFEGEILVGADGIHSLVRRELHGPDKPRYTGDVMWRAMVPCKRLPAHLASHSMTAWLGADRFFLNYRVRADELMNVGGVVSDPSRTSESWMETGKKEDFLAAFAAFHDDARSIISAADECFVQAIHERDVPDTWWNGRVVLIGDACHAMPPYAGQGAGMALEDAIVLARELAAAPAEPATALSRYQEKRIARVRRVARLVKSNRATFIIPSPMRRWLAYRLISIAARLKPTAMQERSAWLYSYDALNA